MDDPGQNCQEWVTAALLRHEEQLLRYAHRITGDADRARDVVQETFLKLCHQDQHALNGRLVQWLYTVCRNQALDLRRKESRRFRVSDEALAIQPEVRETGPVDQASSRDLVQWVMCVIHDLPRNQQDCLRLKFQSGMSYAEISVETGLSESNVGFLIHIGLKTVKERLRRTADYRRLNDQ
jgi:RNA polymerase sigma factor (sigma-70 family)